MMHWMLTNITKGHLDRPFLVKNSSWPACHFDPHDTMRIISREPRGRMDVTSVTMMQRLSGTTWMRCSITARHSGQSNIFSSCRSKCKLKGSRNFSAKVIIKTLLHLPPLGKPRPRDETGQRAKFLNDGGKQSPCDTGTATSWHFM